MQYWNIKKSLCRNSKLSESKKLRREAPLRRNCCLKKLSTVEGVNNGNRRSIDFALESEDLKIAIEIDEETYHNPNKLSSNKYYDDLVK